MFPSGDAPVDCCVITADNDIECGGCAAGELPGTAVRCEESTYSPAMVAVGALDAARREAIKDAISSADDEFYWGTPMAAGLAGALSSQIDKAAAGASSVVLITDGNPTSCDTPSDPGANDIQRVVVAAAAGLGATHSVRTFVIGVIDGTGPAALGANEANLSLIAEAGGTPRYAGCEANADCAYPVNVASFAGDMKAALDAIQLKAFSCTFAVPDVEGGAADLDAVNISVTTNGDTILVKKDTSHQDGWDYLPDTQSVQLYGSACELLENDTGAKVEVVVGCKTEGQ
jgi:hypothetical protein